VSTTPRPEDATPDGDVAIVGAGPVGLTLAILLAQTGRTVTVLERWPSPYALPRAVHFDHEVGRILQSCGIGDELRAITEAAEVYEWRNAAGTTLLRFGRRGAAPSGWPESSMFSQPELEALLARRADALPTLTIRRGTEVAALVQHDDHVEIRDTGGVSSQARYVVGCDGANSTVRGLVGIEPVDLGFFYDWLIVDLILSEPRVFDPLNVQICDPARPTTAVSGGPGRRRWEFMRLPHESLDDLNDEARAWELLAPWDVTPCGATLERHAVYTFQARYAPAWRVGRVLLAGDAAHQMPPFAGQGMCAGIRDAANLAFKLDLVLAGHAVDALLDTYTEERLPSAQEAIRFSMELGKVICVPDPEEAARRDAAMAASVTSELADAPELPGVDTGCIDASTPHAGRLFVQGTVDGRPADDALGPGWRLVTDAPAPDLDPELQDWFRSIGGRVVTVAAGDARARWLSEHEAAFALERPDFHLYGTAADPTSAAALLTDLRHRLTPEPATTGSAP
jgi:2-polyprenyl-6-methoxyphenol hydroxylase-like FAD-dependent oxidoreductase